jgi:hypothetical protein
MKQLSKVMEPTDGIAQHFLFLFQVMGIKVNMYRVLMRSMGDMTMAVTSPAVMDDTKWQAMPSCIHPESNSAYFV